MCLKRSDLIDRIVNFSYNNPFGLSLIMLYFYNNNNNNRDNIVSKFFFVYPRNNYYYAYVDCEILL